MKRVTGILHKMVDASAAGEIKWSQVLNYIDSNCGEDAASMSRSGGSVKALNFDSPLPRDAIPTDALKQELWYDESGHSLVRKMVLKSAPSKIIAAIVHLCPQVLLIQDYRGRLPIHHACRLKPTENQDKIIMILVRASPTSVLVRDVRGRTPLHYLVWYHCPLRSPRVVATFCQRLPRALFSEHADLSGASSSGAAANGNGGSHQHVVHSLSSSSSIMSGERVPPPPKKNKLISSSSSVISEGSNRDLPCNAAVIADNKGCLPLHYAVMEAGDNAQVIEVLIQAYPVAKHAIDVKGRTPLHWYLGASYLLNATSSADDRESAALHVSGEPFPDNHTPWYTQKLNPEIVKFIVTSRVARTADSRGRTPLHWAAHFWAVQAWHSSDPAGANTVVRALESVSTFKLLVDYHVGQLTTIDNDKLTPLMVLFMTTRELQQEWTDWKRPFAIKRKHVEFLLTSKVANMEDGCGRLALHAAVEVLAPDEVVETLILAHPTGLIHATERDSQTPLHTALSTRPVASRQRFEVVDLLLQNYEISKSARVDGRLALKMEDCDGAYVIHLACTNGASLDILKCIVNRYPKTALMTLPSGSLPLHCLVNETNLQAAMLGPEDFEAKGSMKCQGCEDYDDPSKIDLADMSEKMNILLLPLLADPGKLQVVSTRFGMLPIHIAVLYQAAEYTALLRMLELFPQAATIFMKDSFYCFSPLDLHEIAQSRWRNKSTEDWQHIRELLFAFGPTLESHRHREELLNSCVEIIKGEANGKGSWHLSAFKEMENAPDMPDLVLSTTLSQALENGTGQMAMTFALVREHMSTSPQPFHSPSISPRDNKTRDSAESLDLSLIVPNSPAAAQAASSPRAVEHSVYDDYGAALEYVLSEGEYEDDEDESYFSSDGSEEEEYFTEDEKKVNHDHRHRSPNNNRRSSSCIEHPISSSHSQSDSYNSGSFLTRESRSLMTGQSGLSHPAPSYDSKVSQSDVERIFDEAKRKASKKKKKEDPLQQLRMASASVDSEPIDVRGLPDWASPVGMRLWSFFALYRDPANPADNYARQVQNLLAEIDFKTSQKLVSLHLPHYAAAYLLCDSKKQKSNNNNVDAMTFRDAANPKCREFIHRTTYFVGRFEFADHPVLKRAPDNSTVLVQAYEWVFETEEITDAIKPGMSEESIWENGIAPAETGLTFKPSKRPVRILFTQSPGYYRNEIDCRAMAGLTLAQVQDEEKKVDRIVIPIEYEYNAGDPTRQDDRMYRTDIHDERFCELALKSGAILSLSDYNYAVVCADPDKGTVADMVYQQGMSLLMAKEVGRDVAKSIEKLHVKGIVHGNVAANNIYRCTGVEGYEDRNWTLFDLSRGGLYKGNKPNYLGSITEQGYSKFSTATLPPEMFQKYTVEEGKRYTSYWKEVKEIVGVEIGKYFAEPQINMETGELYCVKCAVEVPEDVADKLPPCPYKFVEASPAADVWAFGVLLFQLCAGRPLMHTDERSGHIIELGDMINWTADKAKTVVYRYVSDPLAQDLILRLLAPVGTRQFESFINILEHPFLNPFFSVTETAAIIEKRRIENGAFQRQLQKKGAYVVQKKLLEQRTVVVNCWDFDVLRRIFLSPTELVKRMIPKNVETTLEITCPCALVVLPYLLKNRRDLYQKEANKLGLELLRLNKVCQLAKRIQKFQSENRGVRLGASAAETVGLLSADYAEAEAQLALYAARYIELYRSEPFTVVLMVLKDRVKAVLDCFNDKDSYLYLLDEYNCKLLTNEMYPVKIQDKKKNNIVRNGLLFMYLCYHHTKARESGLGGLAQILLNDKEYEIPASWTEAGRGLSHDIEEDEWLGEVKLIEKVLSCLFDTQFSVGCESLDAMRDYLCMVDRESNFADQKRVLTGEIALWTNIEGMEDIKRAAGGTSFKAVLLSNCQKGVVETNDIGPSISEVEEE